MIPCRFCPDTIGAPDHFCLSFVGIFREAIALLRCTSMRRANDFGWLG